MHFRFFELNNAVINAYFSLTDDIIFKYDKENNQISLYSKNKLLYQGDIEKWRDDVVFNKYIENGYTEQFYQACAEISDANSGGYHIISASFYSDEKERIYRPNSISYSVIEYNFVPKYTVGIISDSMFPDHSLFDPLTGLYNKGEIKRIAVNVLEKAKENHTKAVFVIIDLDYFKEVNDTYGHPVGDIAIKNAARIIKNDVGHKQGKHAKQQRRRRSYQRGFRRNTGILHIQCRTVLSC